MGLLFKISFLFSHILNWRVIKNNPMQAKYSCNAAGYEQSALQHFSSKRIDFIQAIAGFAGYTLYP